jgi:hypothetical protein
MRWDGSGDNSPANFAGFRKICLPKALASVAAGYLPPSFDWRAATEDRAEELAGVDFQALEEAQQLGDPAVRRLDAARPGEGLDRGPQPGYIAGDPFTIDRPGCLVAFRWHGASLGSFER